MVKFVAVFCGSSLNCPETYLKEAYEAGRAIALQGKRLVYGSGSMGSMGEAARGAQSVGGHVTGVNVQLFKDSPYTLAVDTYVVEPSMQSRKVRLIRESDAAIAIPGGMGTLDELTELFVMEQLGQTDIPFGILNAHGYFDGFLLQMQRALADNFLKYKDYARLMVAETIEELLYMLDHYDEIYAQRLRNI